MAAPRDAIRESVAIDSGYVVFVYNNKFYYQSSGANSSQPGMVFPFYGVGAHPDDPNDWWLVKSKSMGLAFAYEVLAALPPRLRELRMDPAYAESIQALGNVLNRLDSHEAMRVSFRCGAGAFWDPAIGDPFARHLQSTLDGRGSLVVPPPSATIPLGDVNVWLAKRSTWVDFDELYKTRGRAMYAAK